MSEHYVLHWKAAKSVRQRCSGRYRRVDDTLYGQLEIIVTTPPLHMVKGFVSAPLVLMVMDRFDLCPHCSPPSS